MRPEKGSGDDKIASTTNKDGRHHMHRAGPCPGEVHPIVFGAYGEASAGMGVLIGRLADAWAPQIAEQHLLDNVLAAEDIAKSIIREEIGAVCASTRTHTSSLGARSSANAGLRRGVRATPRPR
jgi:hypothetical protein